MIVYSDLQACSPNGQNVYVLFLDTLIFSVYDKL